jgi:ATP-dependent DNA helicase RecQ
MGVYSIKIDLMIIKYLMTKNMSQIDIDLEKLINSKDYDLIAEDFYQIKDEDSLKVIWEHFDGAIDYGSLRIGLTLLKEKMMV